MNYRIMYIAVLKNVRGSGQIISKLDEKCVPYLFKSSLQYFFFFNYLKSRENASRVKKLLIYSKGITFKDSFKL